MGPRHLALALMVAAVAWLLPGAARADLKLATLNVKGMVCQA
jgi:hypothetical protein